MMNLTIDWKKRIMILLKRIWELKLLGYDIYITKATAYQALGANGQSIDRNKKY